MRSLMSSLLRLLEQFIAVEVLGEDEDWKDRQVIRYYREHQLSKLFKKELSKAKQQLEKQDYRDSGYYGTKYHLELEEYLFASTQKRMDKLNLQHISDAIDYGYLISKLRHSCLVVSHQAVYSKDYELGMLEEVIEYVRKHQLWEVPAISVYYHGYLALSKPSEQEMFIRFKENIFEYGHLFEPTALRDLYLLALNYCIRQLNAGQPGFDQEGFELYKRGLKTEALMDQGVLSRFTFNNIVGMGVKVKAYVWLDWFMDTYAHHLEKRYQKDTVAFNRARLAYALKQYEQALDYLQEVDFSDLLNTLIAKTLQLKIYYELEAFKLLDAHLDSMRIYIRRKKVIGYHKENYLNIIRLVNRMVSVNFYDKAALSQLKQEIEGAEPLTEKEWLLRCLEGLAG